MTNFYGIKRLGKGNGHALYIFLKVRYLSYHMATVVGLLKDVHIIGRARPTGHLKGKNIHLLKQGPGIYRV